MKAARKAKEALAMRRKVWDDLPSDGVRGTNTKMVKHDNKSKAFIRPGSQNRRKGASGRVGRR